MTSPPTFDPAAPKKPTNVSLNQELVRAAKAYGLNVSRIAEAALAAAVRARAEREWIERNAKALDAYNAKLGTREPFGDRHRRF